jgi:hypothetical protein
MSIIRETLGIFLAFGLFVMLPADVFGEIPPADGYDVRYFGAKGDGQTLDTEPVQKVIDSCAESGGGTVVFPPGTYVCGSLILRSHVTLHIEAGAVIQASSRQADFNKYEELDFKNDADKETSFFRYALFYGENLEDIGIVGRGAIDGNREKRRGPKPIALKRCRHVTIQGITLRNAPNYNISLLGTDYVNIDGVSIFDGHSDGIDPDCCHHVRISNCHIETWDDAIVPKASFSLGERRSTEYLTVTNCVFGSACNCFKLGTESGGDFKHITVSNCVMFRLPQYPPPTSGVSIESVDGANIDGIAVSNLSMTGIESPVFIRLGNRGRDMEAPTPGSIQNVLINNVVALDATRPITIAGIPGHRIRGVTLSDIRVTCSGGWGKEVVKGEAPEHIPKYPDADMWDVLPAYGLFCRHAEDLKFRNLSFDTKAPEGRHALWFEDVNRLEMDSLSAGGGEGSAPLIALSQVRDALVRGCSAPAQPSTFLQVQGGESKGIALIGNDLSRCAKPFEHGGNVRADAVRLEGNLLAAAEADPPPAAGQRPSRFSTKVPYNHPGLVVDLGVGLWAHPLPVDYDGDGDNDLLAATTDVPSNGIYFFENTTPGQKFPVFKPGVRLDKAVPQLTLSHWKDGWEILSEDKRYPRFKTDFFACPETVPYEQEMYSGRDNQWSLADFDGDGVRDLIIGTSDGRDYGWDDAFNEKGEWIKGPLHGYVYVVRNEGTNEAPKYGHAVQIEAGDKPLDVYGTPSPNFADWDGDGDLDLICGEFLDRLTYFENQGTRTAPHYAAGRFLEHDGQELHHELCMIRVAAIDWDKDGDQDLIVGEEDGRVALVECTGTMKEGIPDFLPPRFFQQEAEDLKCGALVTPYSVDWDGDGDEDLICGNTAGYLCFIENRDDGDPPSWAPPERLQAGGKTIRIQAGVNGSIQGPCEAKWGYTLPIVADWDHDSRLDIVINSIWGEVLWYRNIGSPEKPELAEAQPVEVEWEGQPPKPAWTWWEPKGKQLVTQWRTTPLVIDLNEDGLNDLVLLDTEGYLSFFERKKVTGGLTLLPPKRIFKGEDGGPLQLNPKRAGRSGRRQFRMVDWDGDGKRDLLLDSRNISFWRNIAEKPGEFVFRNSGELDERVLAGHTTSPTIVDWNKDHVPDLLIGAEDGYLYLLRNQTAGNTGSNPNPARR